MNEMIGPCADEKELFYYKPEVGFSKGGLKGTGNRLIPFDGYGLDTRMGEPGLQLIGVKRRTELREVTSVRLMGRWLG
jgi:hypothetical protein